MIFKIKKYIFLLFIQLHNQLITNLTSIANSKYEKDFSSINISVSIPSKDGSFSASFDLNDLNDETVVSLSGDQQVENLVLQNVGYEDDYDCDVYSFWSSCSFSQLKEIFTNIGGINLLDLSFSFNEASSEEALTYDFLSDALSFFNSVSALIDNEEYEECEDYDEDEDDYYDEDDEYDTDTFSVSLFIPSESTKTETELWVVSSSVPHDFIKLTIVKEDNENFYCTGNITFRKSDEYKIDDINPMNNFTQHYFGRDYTKLKAQYDALFDNIMM